MSLLSSTYKIDGSTNSGLIEATVYFLRFDVKSFFVNADNVVASVGFTERNTLPYAGGT